MTLVEHGFLTVDDDGHYHTAAVGHVHDINWPAAYFKAVGFAMALAIHTTDRESRAQSVEHSCSKFTPSFRTTEPGEL